MKQKKLPTKKHKGLYVYCSKCKKEFSWTSKKTAKGREQPKCGDSQSQLSRCKFKQKQRYKTRVHIPGGGNAIVSRVLVSATYNEAVRESISFKQDFMSKLFDSDMPTAKIGRRLYLLDAQIAYLDYLNNVGLAEHQKVKRTIEYLNAQEYAIRLFNNCLKAHNIDKRLITFEDIKDTHVGLFHTYLLETKKYGNATYNTKMNSLKAFFKTTIERQDLNILNVFGKVKSRSSVVNRDTILEKDFKALLEIITPENGKVLVGKKKLSRQLYTPYLKDGFLLGLHTGGRREEIVNLKWNMIHEKDGKPSYIAVSNLKVERNLGDGYNENVKPKIIPITKGLMTVLLDMGYENYKGLDRFLIAPERSKDKTSEYMNKLSRGFGHFYKLLGHDKNLSFKCLRKTYLTYLNLSLGTDAKSMSSHASDDVLKKHYIDERIVSKAVKEVHIFG